MKQKLSKRFPVYVAVSWLTAGWAGSAAGHTLSGSLGNAAGATDFYQIACSDDGNGTPADLITSIETTSAGETPHVSVQARVNAAASNSTDPTNGDGDSSPSAKLSAGPNLYNILIDKDGPGTAYYVLQYHCLTSKRVETGATDSPPPVQNQ